ncbi:hypothetical protein HU200_025168 [Digitaria exilis]|uniref:Uncharacterized protein n=1 Tax=Digitaria exilis TaxID=1010633 RepID=A0A835BXN6_9POAL|nr:hypothetical protein HU200_025168 [Digitaria exilis]
MGFFNRKTSKHTSRVKKLLKLALSRLTIARRPRLARKSILLSDIGQLLILGHFDRAIEQVEHVIEEDNMLLALDIIELYCKRLIEHVAKLDKPKESSDDIREAVAGIMFAARWCGDLPELLVAHDLLADKFGSDFTTNAKEGTRIVDPMTEHVIEEDSILEAFNTIELYCNCLIENAKQLDKPHECGDDTREAAAGIMFAAGWCGDLPELLFARNILENKFEGDFSMMAKEGTGIVDPTLVWKFSGNKRNMELKKKVVKEIAAENNIQLNFSMFPEVGEQDGCNNIPHHQELNHKAIYQIDMDGSSESDSDHSSSHNENSCDISDSDGSKNAQLKDKKPTTSVRTRR